MVARATERIRNALKPIIPDVYHLKQDTIRLYSKQVIEEVSKVRELIYVMLKADDGKFLGQLSDLIFDQFLTNALPFFGIEDTAELRLYYEFLSAGLADFIIRWILDSNLTDDQAETLLTEILVQTSTKIPGLSYK
ncbi:MAG: hypothetical protein IJI41_10125 [Anaerolineaceae bacterium]|nr:hypothetical protein [Anaerolineaceae bacterium]